MAIEIEDGTGKANAESYVSVSDLGSYLSNRGLTLAASDTVKEQLLRKAMDYAEGYGHRFSGLKLTRDQALQWPRGYATQDGYELPTDEIPTALKNAVCQLAYDINATDPFPVGEGREVIREKLGPIETEYRPQGATAIFPRFTKFEVLIRGLLKAHSGLSTYRA